MWAVVAGDQSRGASRARHMPRMVIAKENGARPGSPASGGLARLVGDSRSDMWYGQVVLCRGKEKGGASQKKIKLNAEVSGLEWDPDCPQNYVQPYLLFYKSIRDKFGTRKTPGCPRPCVCKKMCPILNSNMIGRNLWEPGVTKRPSRRFLLLCHTFSRVYRLQAHGQLNLAKYLDFVVTRYADT